MELVIVPTRQVNLSISPTPISTENGETLNLRCVTVPVSPNLAEISEPVYNLYQRLQICKVTTKGLTTRKWDLQVYAGVSETRNKDSSSQATTAYDGFLRVEDMCRFGILEKMNSSLDGHLKVKVDLVDIVSSSSQHVSHQWPHQRVHTQQILPFKLQLEDTKAALSKTGTFGCEKDKIDVQNFENSSATWADSTKHITARLTISIVIPEEFISVEDPFIGDKLQIARKLLNDEIATDIIIIPENGVSIKCHRSFLSAQSSVFARMFQDDMKESQSNTVEIPDMTESSVRAFLAYLYYWEIKEATKNSLLCFELLYAGHKYHVSSLENCAKRIILSQENDWFDVDVAMRLFLFARILENGSELKTKAIQVLKSKFSTLKDSENYRNLFKKDPDSAMDLCAYFASL